MDRHINGVNGHDPRQAPVFGMPAQSHLLDYLRVLVKRRWTAISTFTLTLVAVVAYTWTVTPIYQGRVQLLIEDERPRMVVFKDAIDNDREQIDYQQTQVAILQSRALARRTIESLQLWTSPELTGESDRPTSLVGRAASKAASAVNLIVGMISRSESAATVSQNAPGVVAGPETAAQSKAIDAFLARLSVALVRNTRLVVVTFRSYNPTVASEVTNALADAYAKQNVEMKTLASREAVDWLGSQLEDQRKKVEASAVALQRYREQTDSVSADSRENTVVQKLNDLNMALTRAKTERIQKEALYRSVENVQARGGGLETVPSILTSPLVQSLRSQLAEQQRQHAQMRGTLGERHPEMMKLQESIETVQARLLSELSKGVDGLQQDYIAAKAQEDGLEAAVEGQKRQAQLMRRKQIEYDALAHAAATDRQIFETLLQRTKETNVAGQGVGSNIRVIDRADVPRVPISPRTERNLLVGIIAGLILATALAFFVDYLDKSIQTPDALKQQLGLPCLGIVPTAYDQHSDEPLLLTNGVPARFKEAFRMVRTNVLFASSKDEVRTILVTSTGPNEGKTVVATNLAISLAQTGQRVLLIDGDMRRPSVHTTLSLEQEPGLSDVTSGAAALHATIRASSVPGLSLLAAGAIPSNPAELLSSPDLKDILHQALTDYAWVVIDSPPVLAVADASLIANVVQGVLFVVAAERTVVPNALNALEQLDAANARFVGAVLNHVDLERNAFFYSSYYRHDYGRYYGASTPSVRITTVT